MSLKARLATWLGVRQSLADAKIAREAALQADTAAAAAQASALEAISLCHDILGKLETLETGQGQKLKAAIERIEGLSKQAVDAATAVIATTRAERTARPQGWDPDLEDSLTALADLIPPA